MKRYLPVLMLLICLLVAGTGCAVPQYVHKALLEKHNLTLSENARLSEQNKDLKTQNEILANKLTGQQARLAAAHELINELNKGETKAAPEAPKEVWKTNPNTGGIILDNNILFSTGSSKLSSKGEATLKKLSDLLNSNNYAEYFVRVDGHTDDVPVKKTIKENKDNWFLSAKRAHAVLVELKNMGINSSRLFLAGYGENLPLTANKTGHKGTPANRRVEIVLVKQAINER